jgi:hypothetical protein
MAFCANSFQAAFETEPTSRTASMIGSASVRTSQSGLTSENRTT